MKHVIGSLTVGACLLLSSPAVVLATGQPGSSAGVTCGSPGATVTPGNAANAINPAGTNGSPFNPNVPKTYAGNLGSPTNPSSLNANGHASPNAVSQYDIACKNATANASKKQMP